MPDKPAVTYQDHVERKGWFPLCHTYGCLNFCRNGKLCDDCTRRFEWDGIAAEDRPMALMMMRGGASPEMVKRLLKVRAAALVVFERVQSLFGMPLMSPFSDRGAQSMLVDAALGTMMADALQPHPQDHPSIQSATDEGA